MNNKLICCLIFIFLSLYIILPSELNPFLKKKLLINIFCLNIFDNKTIFLIANNPNLSKETKMFLDNYDYSNSIIVRFNGYKPIIKDYCRGKTDIMVYRDNGLGFNGYNKNTYISDPNVIDVFTKISNNEDEFSKYYLKKTNAPSKYTFLTNSFKSLNYPSHCIGSWTTGFLFLIYLYKLEMKNKIYLVGFTFHGGKNNWSHCENWEKKFFYQNINDKFNVEILL